MDAEILQGFIEEAESYLPAICEGIFAYQQDATRLAELKDSYRQAHTIKGAALMMGLPEIGEIGKKIASELDALLDSGNSLSEEKTQEIYGQIMELESSLALVRQSLNESSPPNQDAAAPLQDASFDPEQSEEIAAGAETNSEASSEFEDFEIDPEMLEIFALEADEHLQNICANLEALEKNINNRPALLEIRRSAHTLKGSAGIVGFKKLSALAHRVEDLLDFLAENEIESDKNVFELLLAAAECLGALTGGQDSPELEQTVGTIYARFDEVLAALKTPKLPAAADSAPPAFKTGAIKTAPPPLEAENESLETVERQLSPADSQPRSIVRVSLERLDDLVKLVGEMVIMRSAFEQRLGELEQQIRELHHTTSRLRRSTLQLEVDLEANTLASKSFNPSAYNFAARPPDDFFGKNPNEFDSLEFDTYTGFHQTTRALNETATDTSAISSELDSLLDNFSLIFDSQRRLVEEMQDNLLRLRMVPLSSLTQRLQRTVRVTANEQGKLAELLIENENIEIDTQILDSFVDLLLHLLKNAVAHGIEPPAERSRRGKPDRGQITLSAHSEGTHIVFTVADDGRGISTPALKEKAVQLGFVSESEAAVMGEEAAYALIFLPGLSTANQVSQVSGRGVGMNVVKTGILRRQGTIIVRSEPQKGTSFTIRLPMSLAVTRALLFKAHDQTYAVPLKLVKQVAEISVAELEKAQSEKFLTLDGARYAVSHFDELLKLSAPAASHQPASLLLVEAAGSPRALIVERIIKPEEIVIKPLGRLLRNVPEVIGATILGDGGVVPVLDLIYLLNKKPARAAQTETAAAQIEAETEASTSVLIVDDSPSVRHITSKLLKNAGLEIAVAKDGLEALEILQAARELPDIILTDVEMPRMDGYELLAALKRQPALHPIPVVMITSRAGEKHRRKAFDLGVSEYLSKPFEDSVLLDKIKNLTKKS